MFASDITMSELLKRIVVRFAVLCLIVHLSHEEDPVTQGKYVINDLDGLWTTFDGIGGISGGGATSKLLINYAEPHRSNILDYLFKPGFGASMQILKVEIGGDSQSSDGSESSHMHTPFDENYNRGYEWWLMTEAKKRNPNMKFYGLPWAFPGWVGAGQYNPFINRTATVRYILNWINGAWREHQLRINYIGVWNERNCDKEYVKLLRATLDAEGHSDIRIVVPDAMSWGFLDEIKTDVDYLNAFNIIGQHYPGTSAPDTAIRLDKTLWGSEEYSSYNNLNGAGCWARVLTESPVNGFYSGFVAWNLITSYYDNFPYSHDGLMTANQPWSGHYDVSPPIWITAHYTQFTEPGWFYLRHGRGVEKLRGNGTFVSITSPDRSHLTVVIQAVSPYDGTCAYSMPVFTVAERQTVHLTLGGPFSGIKQLNVWYSFLDYKSNGTVLFQKQLPLAVVDGKVSLTILRNEVYTLTTVDGGLKGDYGKPPPSAPFPVPYAETFEGYQIGEEPFNLAQQMGSFEVRDLGDPIHGKVMTQVVTQPPVDTCPLGRMPQPVTVIGSIAWTNVSVEVDVLLPSSNDSGDGVFLASNINMAGCDTMFTKAVHLWLSVKTGIATLTGNHAGTIVYGAVVLPTLMYDKWFTIGLHVKGKNVTATYNNKAIMSMEVKLISLNGFVAFGPQSFGVIHFDNFRILRADRVADETVHVTRLTERNPVKRRPNQNADATSRKRSFSKLKSMLVKDLQQRTDGKL